MAKFLYLFFFILLSVYAQENTYKNLLPPLRECYENKYLLERDNRLPHTLDTFIAILRKIENASPNMDLRSLSVALLHRFRQDGIAPNPTIPSQDGVTPYAPNTFQFFRYAQTLRLIPGNAILFPNNSITAVERCTLHFMLSSSVEIFQRENEANVCRFANSYRYPRSVKDNKKVAFETTNNDVETLSSDEIRSMTHHKKNSHSVLDPELPPNHPDNSRFSLPPESKCPVENGVVKTPWGAVSIGLVLAGIAAATQPETTNLFDLRPDVLQKTNTQLQNIAVDNKWFATLAGDLAEVALKQGPTQSKLSVGVTGNWNSTALPRWYFLSSNEKFEMTTAEIRGDLDGLILANEINKRYSSMPNLRLSQIFDMYYSPLGFFDTSIRACDRRILFTSVAPNSTMTAQVYSAALLLHDDIARATLESSVIEKFSAQAVNALASYVPSAMNKDLSCVDTDKLNNFDQISVDLTIILDTNWDFSAIKPILATLLENIDINQYNSNFTLINGYDGSIMINSTFNILDFQAYNLSHYTNITHGFDLPKSLKELEQYLIRKLNNERTAEVGGARSNVVLVIPYISDIPTNDKEYCIQTLSRMREQIPDTTLLIATYRSKDMWSDFVVNRMTDLLSISIGDTEEALIPITNLVSRIKQVPKRLINTQCGADNIVRGSSSSFNDYITPKAVNYYKLHPNYFFHGGNTATIKIQGSTSDSLTVCSSREVMHVNQTNGQIKSCASITNNVMHSISISCAEAPFIHTCPPLYITVSANSSTVSQQCTDPRICRFPNSIKYTISYENLVCTSDATKIVFNSFILIIALIFFNL